LALRLLRGFAWRLLPNRRAASTMVAIHVNFDRLASATEACRTAVEEQPANVHAYLNMIDLSARCMGDPERAARYYELGRHALHEPRDVEMLESVYLYTRLASGGRAGRK
jgi:hypothetical protein